MTSDRVTQLIAWLTEEEKKEVRSSFYQYVAEELAWQEYKQLAAEYEGREELVEERLEELWILCGSFARS